MRFSAKQIISFALVIIFFAGFQGGKYFMANRILELGNLFSMLLFFYSAFLANLNVKDKDLRWNWWFFVAILFVCYKFFVPAYIFSQNFGLAMFPSVAASREVLIVFFGPAIYFLYRAGFPLPTIEKLFVGTLVALIINYIFHYLRIDLPSALNSSDRLLAALVVYDPWRGYRLVPTIVAMFLLAVYAPMQLFKGSNSKEILFWLGTIGLVIWALLLFKGRAISAMIILSSIMYVVFFHRKRNLGLFFLSMPVIIAGFTFIVISLPGHLAEGEAGDQARLGTMQTAVTEIQKRPILGFGQQSNYTKTEQELFGPYFFSSDIGFIGTTAKYGIVGASIYLFFSFFVIQRSVRTNWLYRDTYGKNNSLLIAICIIHVATLLNIILSPLLLMVDGLTLSSFLIGYTGALRHQIKLDRNKKTAAKQLSPESPSTEQPANRQV